MKIRHLNVFLVVFGLVLSACSSASTQEPVAEAPEIEAIEPSEAVESAPEEDSEAEGEGESLAEGETAFEVDRELSEARFIIGEILANAPNTVVGVTSELQGGGVLNSLDPQMSRLSAFVIDASSFVTDNSLRNRAIREFILQASQYPVIRFEPTEIIGIPAELNTGESVPFEVVGLLTIREITQEISFSGEATMVSGDRVEGLATATVMRGDFELTIPSVPRVAGVDEEFILEIKFVAVAN